MKPENSLVSRRVAYETDNQVVIIEVWDTSHPDCPWVSWKGKPINPHIRAIQMTPLEYKDAKISLKD